MPRPRLPVGTAKDAKIMVRMRAEGLAAFDEVCRQRGIRRSDAIRQAMIEWANRPTLVVERTPTAVETPAREFRPVPKPSQRGQP